MAVLSVGSGKPYSTIAAAVAAAQNGDTIEVQAGTYVNDYVSTSKNITLQGVGGMASVASTSPLKLRLVGVVFKHCCNGSRSTERRSDRSRHWYLYQPLISIKKIHSAK